MCSFFLYPIKKKKAVPCGQAYHMSVATGETQPCKGEKKAMKGRETMGKCRSAENIRSGYMADYLPTTSSP